MPCRIPKISNFKSVFLCTDNIYLINESYNEYNLNIINNISYLRTISQIKPSYKLGFIYLLIINFLFVKHGKTEN